MPVSPVAPSGASWLRIQTKWGLTLYARLEVGTERVERMMAALQTGAQVERILDRAPAEADCRHIHVVAHALSPHQPKAAGVGLDLHRWIALRHTLSYSSWLNQAELWFAQAEQEMLSCGNLTAASHPRRAVTQYIRRPVKTSSRIQWIYCYPKQYFCTHRTW